MKPFQVPQQGTHELNFRSARDQSGLTLVEVLVSILIITIGALAYTGVSQNFSKIGTDSDMNRAAQVLAALAKNRIQQPDLCSNTIDKTMTFNSVQAQSSTVANGAPVRFDFGPELQLRDGEELPEFGLRIAGSRLYSAQPINTMPDGTQYYHVRLGLALSKIDATVGAVQKERRSIGSTSFMERPVADFILKVSSANQIQGCLMEPDEARCADPNCACASKVPSMIYMPNNPMAGEDGCVNPAHPTSILWQLKYPACECGAPSVNGTLACVNKDGTPHTPETDCGEIPQGYSVAGPNTYVCPATTMGPACAEAQATPTPAPAATPTGRSCRVQQISYQDSGDGNTQPFTEFITMNEGQSVKRYLWAVEVYGPGAGSTGPLQAIRIPGGGAVCGNFINLTCNNGVVTGGDPVDFGFTSCETFFSQVGSPLMVHMNSSTEKVEPIEFTSQPDGISFDLMGENAKPTAHTLKRISWYKSSQYYFLALPDAYGKVNGIDELFGNNTAGPDKKFAVDGYKALAKFDGMSLDAKTKIGKPDGFITKDDPVFSKLRLWNDANYDGIAQSKELKTLDQLNIDLIDLKADDQFHEEDRYGNLTTLKSVVRTKDGKYHLMFDIWFHYYDLDKLKFFKFVQAQRDKEYFKKHRK